MKLNLTLISAFAVVMGLTACDTAKLTGQPDKDSAAPSPMEAFDGPVVAVVNGTELKESLMDAYKTSWETRRPNMEMPDDNLLLNELINSELVYQDAVAKGLHKVPETAQELAMQTRTLLIAKNIQAYFQENPVTDEDRQALYDERVGNTPKKEFKARHILLESEDEAAAIITELDSGADFAELAREKSTGPSNKQGGDLGWFPADRMVAPFSEALQGMEPGNYSSAPVQTQFGWHVILLEDQRETAPPSIDELKDQLTMVVRNQKIAKFFKDLQSKATIAADFEKPEPDTDAGDAE